MGGYHGVPRLIYIIVSDTEAYDLHEHLYVTATHRDLCADTFLHFVTASNFLPFFLRNTDKSIRGETWLIEERIESIVIPV